MRTITPLVINYFYNIYTMKKYLSVALAALCLAACAEKIDNGHSGEVEKSYLAISLSSTEPATRADDGTYQEGAADERAVETAYFFFFTENGDAFPVTASAPGGDKNYLQASLESTTGKDMNNVSDIKNVVLLLENYVGTFPAKMVAVLNWIPTADSYSLENLQETLADVRSKEVGPDLYGKFIMSNAVYAQEGTPATAVYATPLTAENIFTDEANAKANPVTIYVERAAAKVTVTTAGAKTMFALSKPVLVAGNSTDVYAKILGWELYNDYQQSYLVKNIDPAWTNADLGFTWNDSPWYRCYWAESQTGEFENNSFQYEYGEGDSKYYGLAFGSDTDVTAGTYAADTYTYCGENTNRAAEDRTKVILKAQLVDGSGNPIELASWYTTEYIGEDNLRTAVANTLKYTLYWKEAEDSYVGLAPADLKCVTPEFDVNGDTTNGAPAGIEAYEVFFQLSDEAAAKDWYQNVGGAMQALASESDVNGVNAANAYLSANVKPALVYKSGKTYYYIDIKHLGSGLDGGKDGDYGIVRNHIYALNINAIGGYGSPVYTGVSNILTPEYPEFPGDDTDDKSFVSAEVRILSWRLVSQQVTVQP